MEVCVRRGWRRWAGSRMGKGCARPGSTRAAARKGALAPMLILQERSVRLPFRPGLRPGAPSLAAIPDPGCVRSSCSHIRNSRVLQGQLSACEDRVNGPVRRLLPQAWSNRQALSRGFVNTRSLLKPSHHTWQCPKTFEREAVANGNLPCNHSLLLLIISAPSLQTPPPLPEVRACPCE